MSKATPEPHPLAQTRRLCLDALREGTCLAKTSFRFDAERSEFRPQTLAVALFQTIVAVHNATIHLNLHSTSITRNRARKTDKPVAVANRWVRGLFQELLAVSRAA